MYAPGVQNVSGQLMAQGVQQAGQAIASGLNDYYKKKEDKKLEEQGISAMQQFAMQNPDLARSVGLKDPNDKAAYKAVLKSFGGVPQAMQAMTVLNQFSRQQKNDAATVKLFETFRSTGDLRAGLQAYAQAGGTPDGLQAVDTMLARMSAPQQSKQPMIFPNKAALDAKFPADKFDYSMIENPQTGEIQIDKVSPRAPQQSNLPPGYEADPSKPGAIRPIEGSEGDVKRKEAEAAAKNALNQELIRADTILNAVDNVIPKIDALSAGVGGSVLNKIPGTEAMDAASMIDTIKANIGFEQLQNMRKASPTGGALGQVAVKELDMLQASLGNLSTAQSPKQLRKTLGEVGDHYRRWKMTVQGIDPNKAASKPDDIDQKLWDAMTQKERDLWQPK